MSLPFVRILAFSVCSARLQMMAVVVLLAVGSAQMEPTIVTEVSFDGPPQIVFDMDDVRPMGIEDIASVFPVAGPFGAVDGNPGDRLLEEFMRDVEPDFRAKLVPVLQSRFPPASHPCSEDVMKYCPNAVTDTPLHCLGLHALQLTASCKEEIKHSVPFVCSDEIQKYCNGGLDQGVLPCLEGRGVHLDPDCADAIVAARQALFSLAASQKRASAAMSPEEIPPPAKAQPPPGATHCPARWEGPKAGGCCTRRWSPTCNLTCSVDDCNSAGGWEFRWADFRTHPYICCPKVEDPSLQYLGGQPLCPAGWTAEEEGHGHCCRKDWTWECGKDCAFETCRRNIGLVWHDVDEKKESYRCCPEELPLPDEEKQSGEVGEIRKVQEIVHDADALPDTLALGDSWISRPMDLSSIQWNSTSAGAGVVAILLLLLCCCCGGGGHSKRSRNYKDK